MHDKEIQIKILQKTEDLIKQCMKLDDSDGIKYCHKIFNCVNNNPTEKARGVYVEKVFQYWSLIKENLKNKEPFQNSTFSLEFPLEINFTKILEQADDTEKDILYSHMNGIATLLWPDEFESEPSFEEKIVEDIFQSLESLQHIENKTPGHILKSISSNTDLMTKTKTFIEAVSTGKANPHVLLDNILKKVDTKEETKDNENIEELKTIVLKAREKGNRLDLIDAIQIVRQLIATKSFKYFMENKEEILENIPEEAKRHIIKLNSSNISELISSGETEEEIASTLTTYFSTECQENDCLQWKK